MNILVIIFIVLLIGSLWKGYKSGIAKEIHGVVSLFMALVVLSIVFLLIASIFEKNTKTTIAAVVLLVVVSFFYRLLSMLMKSVEILAKLPVISLVNKILGAAAGAIELLFVFWIMYVIIDALPVGQFGEQIMTWTRQSTLLINVYQKNYIANWIASISGI